MPAAKRDFEKEILRKLPKKFWTAMELAEGVSNVFRNGEGLFVAIKELNAKEVELGVIHGGNKDDFTKIIKEFAINRPNLAKIDKKSGEASLHTDGIITLFSRAVLSEARFLSKAPMAEKISLKRDKVSESSLINCFEDFLVLFEGKAKIFSVDSAKTSIDGKYVISRKFGGGEAIVVNEKAAGFLRSMFEEANPTHRDIPRTSDIIEEDKEEPVKKEWASGITEEQKGFDIFRN